MKKLLITSVLLTAGLRLFAQLDSNEIAKLYFTEAQKRFNDNEYATALEYIAKAERELGETNGRILSLKVKTLYNAGQFDAAQEALNLFIEEYASTVSPDLKDETMSYFIKLERYYEKKLEEETRRAEAERARTEALKFFRYVSCSNDYCSNGLVEEQQAVWCYNCNGTGQVTEYNHVQSFLNGLNGTNNVASYKVTCNTCNGSRKIMETNYKQCYTCGGTGKLLHYYGNKSFSGDEIRDLINANREEIDYYIELRAEIEKTPGQKIFPVKSTSSDKYGLCDRNLNMVVPFRYDKVIVTGSEYAIVTSGSKTGLVNNKNQMVLPMEYDWIVEIGSTSLAASNSSGQSLLDHRGKLKGPKVESYKAFNHGHLIFKQDGLFGVMDYEGNVLKQPAFEDALVFNWSPFLVGFKEKEKWAFFNLTSSVKDLFHERFDRIESHTYNDKRVYLVTANGQIRITNAEGALVTNDAFEVVTYKEEIGMLSLKRGSLYGLYDIELESYVPPTYDGLALYEHSPHRAMVQKNGLYGIINGFGRPVISVDKVKVWFNSGTDGFIVQEKENSKKRLVYDTNGAFQYDYKDKD